MTNMPEAKLAREAEIRYASVAMVTDYDCWHEDHDDVSVDQVIKTLLGNADNARKMIVEIVKSFEEHIDPNDPAINCLDTAIITDKSNWTESTANQLTNIAGRIFKN
jgi:5'-methylthioadenosine phosphorylase